MCYMHHITHLQLQLTMHLYGKCRLNFRPGKCKRPRHPSKHSSIQVSRGRHRLCSRLLSASAETPRHANCYAEAATMI